MQKKVHQYVSVACSVATFKDILLELITHCTAKLLSDRCREWLLEDEVLNNGIIGSLDLLVEESSVYSPPYWFATVEELGKVVGVAMHTKPDGMVMTALPKEILQEVFNSVDQVVGPPHRIYGPMAAAEWLSGKWVASRKLRRELQMVWNVYVLDASHPPERDAAGFLRVSTDDDAEFAERWGRAYGDEKPAPVDVSQFMLRKLRRKELFFWDNEGPTTLLTLSGFTEKGVRISAVYTPVEHRGKGYGSAAVASMCRQLFGEGKTYVTLTAIKGDPVERMYQRLGFDKIGARACYILVPLLHEMQ